MSLQRWEGLMKKYHVRFTARDIECLNQLADEEATVEGFESCNPSEMAQVSGGQMLPDSLTLQTNGFGDALCLRFKPDGTVREVVFWNHEGSDWHPYAPSIEQALATTLCPDWEDDALSIGTAFDVEEQKRIAYRALHSGFGRACSRMGGESIARQLGVSWTSIRKWLWDTSLIPEDARQRLATILHDPTDEPFRQNWLTATQAAESILRTRRDLAWPFAVKGWSAERSGDIANAIEIYTSGLAALGSTAAFSDTFGFVENRSTPKFVVWRLVELAPQRIPPVCQAYLDAALEFRTRDYWIRQAEVHEQANQLEKTYECYYRVGWDSYGYDFMPETLNLLSGAATKMGSRTLEALAKHHLSCYTAI